MSKKKKKNTLNIFRTTNKLMLILSLFICLYFAIKIGNHLNSQQHSKLLNDVNALSRPTLHYITQFCPALLNVRHIDNIMKGLLCGPEMFT